MHTYPPVLFDGELRILGRLVQLEKVLALLREAAGEKVGKESLDGAKHKDVTNW
jgi:hypothetical protein